MSIATMFFDDPVPMHSGPISRSAFVSRGRFEALHPDCQDEGSAAHMRTVTDPHFASRPAGPAGILWRRVASATQSEEHSVHSRGLDGQASHSRPACGYGNGQLAPNVTPAHRMAIAPKRHLRLDRLSPAGELLHPLAPAGSEPRTSTVQLGRRGGLSRAVRPARLVRT